MMYPLALIFIRLGDWLLGKLLKPRGVQENLEFARMQNPNSEALRAIYREIDEAVGITDPDLLTPPASIPQPNIYEGVGLEIGRFPAAGKRTRPASEYSRRHVREEQPVSFAEMAEILRKQGKDLSQH
jgi:hypothetical protein